MPSFFCYCCFNSSRVFILIPNGTHTRSFGFLCFKQSHKDFRSYILNPWKSAWAYTTCTFWCFPNFLGIKVNNPIARNLRQPRVVRCYVSGKPTRVWQILDHSEGLHASSSTVPQEVLPIVKQTRRRKNLLSL